MRGHSYIHPGAVAALLTRGEQDLIAARRSNSPEAYGNPYDPNSLVSPGEDPLTAYDHRNFPTLHDYKEAVAGRRSPDWILANAPRVLNNPVTSYGVHQRPVTAGLEEEAALAEALAAQGDDDITEVAPGIQLISMEALAAGRVSL